jgi:hypothetical protein
MPNGRRTFGVTTLIALLAYACFFAIAVVSYSANEVVPAFALRWEAAKAMQGFLGVLPGLLFLSLAVALGSSKGKADELIQASILPMVLLSSLLAAFALLAGPQIEASLAGMRSSSAAFGSSLAAARSALDAGDLAHARSEFTVCRAISPRDSRLDDVESKLSSAELKVARDALPAPPREISPPNDPVAAKDYYLKALSFAEKGDYFSANWYASTAARLDASYTDARRLAAKSWEELHARGADPSDRERAAFYARKLEGYGLLSSNDPVGAYRVFKELSEETRDKKKIYADDPDVRRYLAESLAGTEKAAFFKDEADEALADFLVPDIFFRVPAAADPGANANRKAQSKAGAHAELQEGPLRIIAAKDAAWAGGALYFREFEYLETGPKGVRALVRSPFAKLTDGKVFLVCVERDKPANVYKPAWSSGPVSGPASLLELPILPESAYRALASRVAPAALSAFELWKSEGDSKTYGIDSGPLVDELLRRSAMPFALFTAAALGGLFGSRFRRREGDFPRVLYTLVPLMAAALIPSFLVVDRIDALISAWSVKLLPGLSSLVVSAGIRTLVLFLAVLLMAGARDGDGEID